MFLKASNGVVSAQKILLYIVNLFVGYQQAYAARSIYYCFLKGRLF